MKYRLIGVMAMSITALALSACGDMANNNHNANANANMANANVNTNAERANANANDNANARKGMTREEYEKDKARYQKEAKDTGRTIGTGVNDGWLWVKTRFDLAAADDLRDSTINVDVSNDVVTLSGTVASADQKTRAEQVAKSVEGVKSVKNNLTVKPSGNASSIANSNANKARTNMNTKH